MNILCYINITCCFAHFWYVCYLSNFLIIIASSLTSSFPKGPLLHHILFVSHIPHNNGFFKYSLHLFMISFSSLNTFLFSFTSYFLSSLFIFTTQNNKLLIFFTIFFHILFQLFTHLFFLVPITISLNLFLSKIYNCICSPLFSFGDNLQFRFIFLILSFHQLVPFFGVQFLHHVFLTVLNIIYLDVYHISSVKHHML